MEGNRLGTVTSLFQVVGLEPDIVRNRISSDNQGAFSFGLPALIDPDGNDDL